MVSNRCATLKSVRTWKTIKRLRPMRQLSAAVNSTAASALKRSSIKRIQRKDSSEFNRTATTYSAGIAYQNGGRRVERKDARYAVSRRIPSSRAGSKWIRSNSSWKSWICWRGTKSGCQSNVIRRQRGPSSRRTRIFRWPLPASQRDREERDGGSATATPFGHGSIWINFRETTSGQRSSAGKTNWSPLTSQLVVILQTKRQ